jgi:hypothetical protein
MYSREIRQELDLLSKEVFGSRTKWRRMVEQGVVEPVLEDTTRYVPDPDSKNGEDYKTEVVKTNVTHHGPNGGELNMHTIKRYTVEEIKQYMLDRKKQTAELMALIRKNREEQRAKEEAAKNVVADNSGSAI